MPFFNLTETSQFGNPESVPVHFPSEPSAAVEVRTELAQTEHHDFSPVLMQEMHFPAVHSPCASTSFRSVIEATNNINRFLNIFFMFYFFDGLNMRGS